MLSRMMPVRASFLFTITLALGSFLLFSLEPMVAKSLLPSLGGAPMVWNTCVVFFQSILLLGYGFAHAAGGASRLGAAALVAGGAVAAVTLPVTLQDAVPAGGPAIWLLSQLARSIAAVFFVLSAAAPALQVWFSKLNTPRSTDPYFLYAASNAGSFAALLAYPVVIEPLLPLRDQHVVWSALYLLFVLFAALCFRAVPSWDGNAEAASSTSESRPSASDVRLERWMWFGLAFVPSSLMLGVTTYISTDVAAVPLVWVAPLALYLLTFVLAFGGNAKRITAIAARRMPVMLCAVIFLMGAGIVLPITFNVLVHLATFFVVAIVAHGTLACRRPALERLTEFYLIVSAGGVSGGLFNVFVAPSVFTASTEYPLVLLAGALILLLHRQHPESPNVLADVFIGVAAVGVGLLGIFIFGRDGAFGRVGVILVGLLTVAALSQARRPRRFLFIATGILLASFAGATRYGHVLLAERTFFGTYRVTVTDDGRFRELYHGTTLHGRQSAAADAPPEPLTYYHRLGPFGQAHASIRAMAQSRNVAVIGLGVGSLAAYADARQHWTFFEIDPAVERIARDDRHFSFLKHCASRCSVVIGDARLSLRRTTGELYDLFVMDAFSSDTIPVHLLTRDAFREYLARLSLGGVIAVHISNRYLDLRPVLAGLATSFGLTAFEQLRMVGGGSRVSPADPVDSHWVIMSRDEGVLESLRAQPQWNTLHTQHRRIVWTDEYSNILSVLGR